MKQILSIGVLLVGGCVLIAHQFTSDHSMTPWTPAQQESLEKSHDKAFGSIGGITAIGLGVASVGDKPLPPPTPPKPVSKEEREASKREYETQKTALDNAVDAGIRNRRILYWSGVALIVAGAFGIFATRNSE